VIEVAHAPRPRPNSADDEIVRRLEAASAATEVRVVTSDRWLGDRARALGATVVSAESFRSWLD
jgi:rRNA-processing protein FCF1